MSHVHISQVPTVSLQRACVKFMVVRTLQRVPVNTLSRQTVCSFQVSVLGDLAQNRSCVLHKLVTVHECLVCFLESIPGLPRMSYS
jgi:hypothetical protein